ncbi:MAG TPA: hypothetical protein VN613_02665 [Gemmatimonadaceae bacterium]|nr:hypothetical protein [Gemmatimonadaceae bacterium]
MRMSNMNRKQSRLTRRLATASAACALGLIAQFVATEVANAAGVIGAREQAKRMFDRIAGVPATEAQIVNMVADINAGRAVDAALKATDAPSFYNVTLKNLVTPWTNRDQTVFAPLNDYTATVIGMVRDNVAFNTALSADILYTVDSPGLPAVSANGNDHYDQAEQNGVDLKAHLVATQQSTVYGTPAAATAGLITTRAASAAFFIAGTNRAMFRFTLINHLCRDMEQVHDTSRPPDRIRQDVSRSPGGDSRIFLNNCIGCHSGMDPMAQAFAYYNYDGMDATAGKLVYTPGAVQGKYAINVDNFKPGFVTPDDAWENRWRHGQNSLLGWSGSLPGSGNGAKSLGEELASSDAFAECQVQKVYKAVCFRMPQKSEIDSITASFRASGYRLRQVFADSAVACMGQ